MNGNELRRRSTHLSWSKAISIFRHVLKERHSTQHPSISIAEPYFKIFEAMTDEEVTLHVFQDEEMSAMTDLMMILLPIESDEFSILADFMGECMGKSNP